MKYKKYSYIFLLVLMLLIGINETYADNTCYYASNDKKVLLSYDKTKELFTIQKRGDTKVASVGTTEPLINNNKSKKDSKTGLTVNAINSDCPSYIVYRHNAFFFGSDGVWGFNSSSEAQKFSNLSNEKNKLSAWVLSYRTDDGSLIEKDEFVGYVDNSGSGTPVDVNCDGIFGDKNNPESLRYLLDEIMQYPRYIVPIIVIGLGMVDFAKAVIASKEDEMKKAQSTFIKRCFIGVCVFLIPVLVDIIMYIADIVWNGMYPICRI